MLVATTLLSGDDSHLRRAARLAVSSRDRQRRPAGAVVGETLGYALTAVFTVLVVRGLGRILPRWLAVAGYVAAALIATGVVVPVVQLASLTNFVGYVLWCLWLLTLAVALFRASDRPSPDRAASAAV